MLIRTPKFGGPTDRELESENPAGLGAYTRALTAAGEQAGRLAMDPLAAYAAMVAAERVAEAPAIHPGGRKTKSLVPRRGFETGAGWRPPGFALEGFPRAENFEMIAPESAFHRGPKEAQLFEIVVRKGGLALPPLSR